MVNFLIFIAKQQPSSRYLLAAEIPQQYDGSRRHSNSSSCCLLAGSMLRYSRGSMLRDTANESRYDGVDDG
ncbi:hypothetical protein HUB90_07185 [Wolbachia endosymbiont of Kradibia gibbosae]|uniref:hypothetical protein n=1 Tax=Wolbachia endosymbiont of Kradibia gibbosae TaxID=2742716 RepID=UPI0018D6BF37|nr:hypothetical protein [Wolbachia endosymbiont of Kradibia gibbosae]MBH5362763.1 hypothetical protein [Wolbachia endosymbiont of Kradibia gibbosae]